MSITAERLFEGFDPALLPGRATGPFESITSDSRNVKPGTVFVAVCGEGRDGHEFVAEAASRGAVLVVAEKPVKTAVPVVIVPDSREVLARLAANFYDNPSRFLTMIGITGTSGKTTVTYIVESILREAGFSPGVIGTVNFRYGGRIFPSTHTTPGPVELQGLLAAMHAAGCDAVVMEVSSHALKQKRADNIAFDSVVFTNLSPEHLDYHPDMEDYYAAKRRLFVDFARYAVEASKRPFAGVNIDDEYGRRLYAELCAREVIEGRHASFGMGADAAISGAGLKYGITGIAGEAAGLAVESPLVGAFNASNILAAIAAAEGLRVQRDAIVRGIRALAVVPGRLERVPDVRGVNILVDYAHKPDALDKVLRTLREARNGKKLITVFGCGGDRDRTKRPVMGRLAAELSDSVYVTSDNPRTEEPRAIIEEILCGMKGFGNFEVEPDRALAIRSAVSVASPGDIVLIAGKGHEDYQIIRDPADPRKTVKIHFDDREAARITF